ncbi:unnamed protein product, partial [Polarella glacialis]
IDEPWSRIIPGTRLLNASDEWWTRSKVRAYCPPLSIQSLTAVIKEQGWPVSSSQRAAAVADASSCAKASASGIFPQIWCELVVASRRTIGPLTARSGWTFRTSLFRWLWPGASDLVFLDVHFALLVGPLVLLVLTKTMFRFLTLRCSPRLSGKAKQE